MYNVLRSSEYNVASIFLVVPFVGHGSIYIVSRAVRLSLGFLESGEMKCIVAPCVLMRVKTDVSAQM